VSQTAKGIKSRVLQPTIICAVAVGYSDPDFPANKQHIARDPVQKNVVFLDD